MNESKNQVGKSVKEEMRKIVPIVYVIILWIIGLGLLIISQYNFILHMIAITYIFSVPVVMVYLILEQQKVEQEFGEVNK